MTTRNTQRGGALVEFAMILPLAMIFLVGIIEFGIVLFQYHATAYAAKFGARYASVRGSDCSASGCPITNGALQTAVQKAVPGAGSALVVPSYASPDPTNYSGTAGSSIECDSSHQSKGCFVTVTVTNSVGLNIPFVTSKNLTFVSTATEVIPQ